MSSDLFEFDDSFFSDPFSPFADSPIDILHPVLQNPVDDQISPSNIFSTSPPSHQLENLSLRQNLQNGSDSSNQFADLSSLEVKTEDCRFSHGCDSFGPHSYGEISADDVAKMMQRSFSGGSFDGKPGFSFRPQFDSVVASPNFHLHVSISPENRFSTGQMRRGFSTGDLQVSPPSPYIE
ncbi:hypothetical protein U1Q18_021222 [Sarracenia purpurea var. burkii]